MARTKAPRLVRVPGAPFLGHVVNALLESTDGTPADPPEVRPGIHHWNPGDTITLGAGRSLRVVDVRDEVDDEPSVLVVEEMSS